MAQMKPAVILHDWLWPPLCACQVYGATDGNSWKENGSCLRLPVPQPGLQCHAQYTTQCPRTPMWKWQEGENAMTMTCNFAVRQKGEHSWFRSFCFPIYKIFEKKWTNKFFFPESSVIFMYFPMSLKIIIEKQHKSWHQIHTHAQTAK